LIIGGKSTHQCHKCRSKFKNSNELVALGITLSGVASLSCPINPATYQFSLSRYPTNGEAVAQFPDHYSRASYRGKFYISLYVRGSVKKPYRLKSPIGSLSNAGLYSTRAEADIEVLSHRCVIEGMEKRGEHWFLPSSSPSAKPNKASVDREVAALDTNIKSLRSAVDEKAVLILSLESQLCTARAGLATLKACLLQAEAAAEAASASPHAFPADDKQPNDSDDEAMPPINEASTPSKGIS